MAPFSHPARTVVGALVAATLLAACGATQYTDPEATTTGTQTPVPSSFAPVTVTLVAHDSFALTKTLLEDFR